MNLTLVPVTCSMFLIKIPSLQTETLFRGNIYLLGGYSLFSNFFCNKKQKLSLKYWKIYWCSILGGSSAGRGFSLEQSEKTYINNSYSIKTLFAHIKPHALHKVLGPAGPRRIAGVLFSLTPQCWHFRKLKNIYKKEILIKVYNSNNKMKIYTSK